MQRRKAEGGAADLRTLLGERRGDKSLTPPTNRRRRAAIDRELAELAAGKVASLSDPATSEAELL